MASKAEAEKMAIHIWDRILRPAERRHETYGIAWVPFNCLKPELKTVCCDLARWHLRKLQQAYNRGLDDVAGSGDYD